MHWKRQGDGSHESKGKVGLYSIDKAGSSYRLTLSYRFKDQDCAVNFAEILDEVIKKLYDKRTKGDENDRADTRD